MLLTLGDFHTMVEDALGRPSLNSRVPRRVEMASRWLERNYTFQYMRTWKTLTIDPTADYPHIISLYDLELKGIDLVRSRQLDSDGNIIFSRPWLKLKPQDRETRAVGVPESFWLNGMSSIVLNSIPDTSTILEAHLIQFSKWNRDSDSWRHWLLDNATQLLLCRTLMMMATGPARDADLYATYKADFDLEIATFTISEEELQSGDVVQVWEPPEYAEHDNSLRSA